jgi:hypothetical protein
MLPEVISVSFTAQVQKGGGRFSVPTSAASALGIPFNGEIALVVKAPSGAVLYAGTIKMESRCEIYGDEVRHLPEGERILVEASRPLSHPANV